MGNPSQTKLAPIQAAGGIVWRRGPSGHEVAIIHRARYGDWTLPKGKWQAGESYPECALREVREETGLSAALLGFAGAVAYFVAERPKVVRFWHMRAESGPVAALDPEVAEVVWLPVREAGARLDYPLERALLELWQTPTEMTS